MSSARFTFIGKLEANTDIASKGYFLREGKTSSGNPYASVNLQIAQEKNNRAFIELFGMQSSSIKTLDNNMKKTEIKWDDRFDEDVIKDVANFKKTIVKLGDDKKEYISSYDAVNYIAENIKEFNGKTVVVSGQRKKNVYNGKVTDRFEFGSIRTVGEEEEVINRLTVNMDFLFTKESFDTNDWKDEKKLYINGWTSEYMSDVKEDRFVDQTIVLDCTKIDFENEKHIKQLKFRLNMFGCDLDDNNKILVKVKAKKIFKLGIVTTFVNGQEKVEFDESMLTDLQKEALELGLKTLDDFRPSGSIFGERVQIYKLRDFNLRDDSDYKDGYIDTDFTQDEFDEKYYVPVKEDETEESIIEEKKSSDDTEDAGEDDDDLFG